MKKLLLILIPTLLVSCAGNGSRNSNEDFFEGVVTPGLLTGKYYNTSNAAGMTYTINEEITIYDDHTFELRRKTSGLYNGGKEIKTFYGTIRKHKEEYNGAERIWFTFDGHSEDNWATGFAIETNGTCVPGACGSYHEIYLRKNDNRSDSHWTVRHQ